MVSHQLEFKFHFGENVVQLHCAQRRRSKNLGREARIFVFPLHQQQRVVRDAADQLLNLPEEAARSNFWRDKIGTLRVWLLARTDPDKAESELRAFRRAVQSELDHRCGVVQSQPRGRQ